MINHGEDAFSFLAAIEVVREVEHLTMAQICEGRKPSHLRTLRRPFKTYYPPMSFPRQYCLTFDVLMGTKLIDLFIMGSKLEKNAIIKGLLARLVCSVFFSK